MIVAIVKKMRFLASGTFPLSIFLLGALLFSHSETIAREIILAGETERIIQHAPFVDCTFSQLDYKYRTVAVPWKRAQASTQNGIYDGFFMATQNEHRDSYATLSDPFFEIEWLYVVRKGSGIFPSNPDFFKNTFSAVDGGSRMKWLKKKMNKIGITKNIIERHNSENVLTLLKIGRVDVNVENNRNLTIALEKTGFDRSEFETFVIKTLNPGVYFSNKLLADEPEFLNQFNAAIKSCRED